MSTASHTPKNQAGLTHQQAQYWLQSGEVLDSTHRSMLNEHLAGCVECREYAVFITGLEQALPAAVPDIQLNRPERYRQAQAIQKAVKRRRLSWRISSGFHSLAWASVAVMLVAVLGWSVRNLLPQILPAAPPPILVETDTPASTTTEATLVALTATPGGTTAPVSTSPTPPKAGWQWYQHDDLGFRIAYPESWTAEKEWGLQQNSQKGEVGPIQSRVSFTGESTVEIDTWDITALPDFDLLEWINTNPEAVLYASPDEALTYNARVSGQRAVFFYQASAGPSEGFPVAVITDGEHLYRISLHSTEIPPQPVEAGIYLSMLESFSLPGGRPGTLSIPGDWQAKVGLIAPVATPTPSPRPVFGTSHWLAFVSERDGYPAVYVSRTDGTRLSKLVEGLAEISSPTWSPDGKRLAFHATSPDNGSWDIFVVNADGSGLTNLTSNPADDFDPAWSLDGSRIAFLSDRDRSGKFDIYMLNFDGTQPTRLTFLAAWHRQPVWSPDGSRIAFSSEMDGDPEIYVINADGSGLKRLTQSAGGDGWPTWSPDGTRLAFTSERNGTGDIFVMSADGSDVYALTSDDAWDTAPAWSPDGRQIAFLRTLPDGQGGIYVMKADGSEQARVPRSKARDQSIVWYPGSAPEPDFGPAATAAPREGRVEVDPRDPAQAEETLLAFFSRLHAGKYAEAAGMFGGSYEVLVDYNPILDPRDQAALWQNACTINGFHCLPVKTVELKERIFPGEFHFLVEFENEDGSLFVLGPCCGSDATQTPPSSQFAYTVLKDAESNFKVLELPVYQP